MSTLQLIQLLQKQSILQVQQYLHCLMLQLLQHMLLLKQVKGKLNENVCIVTQVGIYCEIQPEPLGNPSGSALGISLGLRLYFTVYPSSRHNTDTRSSHPAILNYLQTNHALLTRIYSPRYKNKHLLTQIYSPRYTPLGIKNNKDLITKLFSPRSTHSEKCHNLLPLISYTFKASALWADAFCQSKCPSVCPCVRVSLCSLFEVPFKQKFFFLRIFAPTSQS